MRKFIAVCMCVSLLLAMCVTNVMASEGTSEQTYEEGGFKYSVEDGKASITGYTGTEHEVVIPEQLGDCPVTGIESLESENDIISLTIPASVISIKFTNLLYSELKTITVDVDNPNYKTVDNVLFSKDMKDLIYCAPNSHKDAYVIPDGVVNIKDRAFCECDITGITIPDSVKTIGDQAFFNCDFIDLAIPASVTSIGERAFATTIILHTICVDADNQYYSSENNVLYNKNQDELILCAPGSHTGQYVIQKGVRCIKPFAFMNCYYLTDIIISDGVETIGSNAFYFTNSNFAHRF